MLRVQNERDLTEEEFASFITGKTVRSADFEGGWLRLHLSTGQTVTVSIGYAQDYEINVGETVSRERVPGNSRPAPASDQDLWRFTR